MIAKDQPTIFNNDIVVALSSVDDGNMSFKYGESDEVIKNRKAFFEKAHLNINDATLVQLSFEGVTDFARYTTLTDAQKGEGMFAQDSTIIADALVVTQPGHAIFLPVADCTATVIYDSKHHILMMSHLGRQSTEIYGAKLSVEYLQHEFGSEPKDLKVWMGPAVGKDSYKLYKLDNKGLHEAILEQFQEAGVDEENIEISSIDTAIHPEYFSHSASMKGDKEIDEGRFAVVAAMRVQGEPAS